MGEIEVAIGGVLFVGDTDDQPAPDGTHAMQPDDTRDRDEFDRPPGEVLRSMFSGGVSLPWNLALAGLVGLSLLFTRVTLGAEGDVANAHHVIGCLVLTVCAIAAAEMARPVRLLNGVLGLGLALLPLVFDADKRIITATVGLGLALMLLSIRRGRITERYGSWNRWLV